MTTSIVTETCVPVCCKSSFGTPLPGFLLALCPIFSLTLPLGDLLGQNKVDLGSENIPIQRARRMQLPQTSPQQAAELCRNRRDTGEETVRGILFNKKNAACNKVTTPRRAEERQSAAATEVLPTSGYSLYAVISG